MGGDLLPIPLVRIRAGPAAVWKEFNDSAYDYEIPKMVKFRSPRLASFNKIMKFFALALMAVYVLYVDKGYLRDVNIEGYSRVTLQHPVQNCNPLHSHCKSNLKAMDDLKYCDTTAKHKGSNGKDHAVGCKYLDTFDVYNFNTGLSLGNILVPTRVSTFQQTETDSCKRRDKPCVDAYTVDSETHDFVADIEDFTLLIDHGYSCPMARKKGASWSTVGFYAPANEENDWGFPYRAWHNWPKPFYIPCADSHDEDCYYAKEHQKLLKKEDKKEKKKDSWQIPKIHGNLLNRTTDNYDATGPGKIISSRFGDIVKVSDLLEIAGVNLEKRNFGHNSLRTEGEVIIIEIAYSNNNHWHWPNHLAPVYKYRIYSAPADSFKMTRVQELGGGKRTVTDVHGIQIITRVTGHLGVFSAKTCVMSLVELSIALGLVNWVLHCCALNMKEGERIIRAAESLIEEEVPAQYDPLAGTSRPGA